MEVAKKKHSFKMYCKGSYHILQAEVVIRLIISALDLLIKTTRHHKKCNFLKTLSS